LSSDISFEFYDRNPLFSKEGRHTLDIDIDLGDPVNANVYRNMYRIDVLRRPSGRSAVLFSERGVILRGTEVVLQVDEKVAKIQLVAGNSELNYLSGGDSKMTDLDLGEITGLTVTVAWNSLSGSYPTWDYVCAPVCTQTHFFEDIMPIVGGENPELMNELERTAESTIAMKSDTTLCPQPYLAAMVRKVITALGYNITSNFLETDTNMKKVILVNGYHALKYNEMIPDWKVDDFLTEVEKFTGCIIVVNQTQKSVEILQANEFYDDAQLEKIDENEIIGDVEKRFDESSPEGVLYHNISYKFPDSEIYRYWSVDKDFINSLTIQQCPNLGSQVQKARYFNFLIDIWTALNNGSIPEEGDGMTVPDSVKHEYNKMIAYDDLGMDFDTYFVIRSVEQRSSSLRRLNYYGARSDSRSDDSMDIRIVPAEVVWKSDANWSDQLWDQPYLLARNSDSQVAVTDEESEKGLNDYLAEGFDKSRSSDVLYAAFYLGFKDNNFSMTKEYSIMSPVAVPSNEVERFFTSIPFPYGFDWWSLMEIVNYGESSCCMAINGEHGMYETYWKNNLAVNFTQPYKIRFKNVKNRDARNIFVIANKKFYCQELKYQFDGGRQSDVVEGTFFPVIGDADTPVEGETVNIQVKIDQTNGYVKLYADKVLSYPITVQLTGTASGTTYSMNITMDEGTSQKSVRNNTWVSICESFAAAVAVREEDDNNTYVFTINVNAVETINITLTIDGTSVTATADDAVNSEVVITLTVTYEDTTTEDVTITMVEGSTTASATSTGDMSSRASETTSVVAGSGDTTNYLIEVVDGGWQGVKLTAVEDCVFTFKIASSITAAQYEYLEYSLDGGQNWTRLTNVNSTEVSASTSTVAAGGKVCVRGKGTKMGYWNGPAVFSSTGTFDAKGDIMSLLYLDDFAGTAITADYAFAGIFRGSPIRDASAFMLSPTTLRTGSYAFMFYGCTSLTHAPQMAFTGFASGSVNGCYAMFRECTSLANVQDTLYPTTLASGCYAQMFNTCRTLVNAPALPATALVNTCYNGMFLASTSLRYLKCMSLTELGTSYTQSWVDGIPAGGIFVKNSAATWENTFTRHTIPSESGAWTVETADV